MFRVSGAATVYAIVAQAFGRIRNFQFRRGTPQTFQIVISPRLFAEHVDDEPPKIKERPFRGALPFPVLRRALRVFVQLFFDLRTNGLHLWGAEAGTDHEVFRERTQPGQIEYLNGSSFTV